MIPCVSATCTQPPREAMLCVTVGEAEIRRVICIECRVVLDRQGRAVNVHHGASVATWCDSRLIPIHEREAAAIAAPGVVPPEAAGLAQVETLPSHPTSPQVVPMPVRCLFPGCESSVVKSRGLCGRDLARAKSLGMLEVADIDYPALGPAWAAREAARGEVNTEIARLTAALEASHAREVDTIESVGRLERERDEARAIVVEVRKQLAVAFESSLENQRLNAELAKVAALLDAEGAGADGEPEPVSTTLRYWLEACKQTEIELRYSRDEALRLAESRHRSVVWFQAREADLIAQVNDLTTLTTSRSDDTSDYANPTPSRTVFASGGYAADLEAIDAALGYDEHDTRHDGDRVERIEELHERLLCAEQDRDRATAKMVETQKELASARAESAHLALDLGPGLLDARSERAIGIALGALGELGTDPAVVALLGVVRALCGIGLDTPRRPA